MIGDSNVKNLLKHHLHHFILALSILSLTALLIWWTIFLRQSISNQRLLKERNLILQMETIAVRIQNGSGTTLTPGIFGSDPRFEIIESGGPSTPTSRTLPSGDGPLTIRIRPQVLNNLEEEYSKKKIMLQGESTFLAVLIFLGFLFLYNYIRLERRANREVRKFWERVTHELKTPITGLRAYIESVTPENVSSPKFWDLREQAMKLIGEQELQIEAMLNISNIKRRQTGLNLSPLDFNAWLDQYIVAHALDVPAINIEVKPTDTESLRVKANRHGLKIIMDNILDNALKYCPEPVVLSIAVGLRKRKAVISISDNGPGVERDKLDKIFQSYESFGSDSGPVSRGSGMGLAIARDVARKMRGDMKARNHPDGRGLELLLSLRLD
jgi:signal transduction histidine kinase